MFDMNDKQSFDKLPKYLDGVKLYGTPECIVVLVGTKADLTKNVTTEEGMSYLQ